MAVSTLYTGRCAFLPTYILHSRPVVPPGMALSYSSSPPAVVAAGLVVRRAIGDNLAQPVPPVLQRLHAGVAGGDFEGDHAGRKLGLELADAGANAIIRYQTGAGMSASSQVDVERNGGNLTERRLTREFQPRHISGMAPIQPLYPGFWAP